MKHKMMVVGPVIDNEPDVIHDDDSMVDWLDGDENEPDPGGYHA